MVHENESWGEYGSCWICDAPLNVPEEEHFRLEHPTAHEYEYGCDLTKLPPIGTRFDPEKERNCTCKRSVEATE